MKIIKIVLLLIAFSVFAGCATKPTIVGSINPHSKFAKLQLGMGEAQAIQIAGLYSDLKTYNSAANNFFHNPIPGKEGIGFFTDYYFKGEGILTFEGLGTDKKLVRITADANENGFKKN